MNFPAELLYTKDHEWISIDGDVATVGITDFAQSELGDIVYVDITTLGQQVGKHDVFGTVEAVKTVSDLFLPLAGEVTEFNESINDNPEVVNKDPYGAGWIVKVKLSDAADRADLLTADAYKAHIGQ